jgi:protein-disulfide isomerase
MSKFIVSILIYFILVSCLSREAGLKDAKLMASIESTSITYAEVDNRVGQQIFDELNRIYLIRKVALEELIEERLLELEASRQRVSTDSLMQRVYAIHGGSGFSAYLAARSEERFVTEYAGTLIQHDVNSKRGQELLLQRYQEATLDKYLDSLKQVYHIQVMLTPPMPLSLKLNLPIVHYRGDLESKVTVMEISDYDCSMCREHKSIMDSLFTRYRDQVRFGFTHYSSYVSVSARAAESASKQDRFWDMHAMLFQSKSVPDSNLVYNMAQELMLDMDVFNSDFKSSETYQQIYSNLKVIESAGVYGTPTILINNRPVFNSASFEDIEKRINDALANNE